MLILAKIWKIRGLIGMALVVLAAIAFYWWITSVLAENERLNDKVKEQEFVIRSQVEQIAKERLAFKLADDLNNKLEKEAKALEAKSRDVIDSLNSDDLDDPAAKSIKEYLEKIK